jgi:putative membrane protein
VDDPDERRAQPRRRPHRHLVPPDPRGQGTDPDYRFSLANERTFLAWIRTSLALAAGGLGAASLLDDFPGEEVLGIGLLLLSFVTASMSYRRWALTEMAIRVDEPLPESKLPLLLAGGVALIVVASAVLVAVNA